MTVQTSVVYAGAGDVGPFAVPFPYLSKSHITVQVDGADVAFSWPTDSAVQLTVAAADGAVIEIRRTTPRDARLVDFTDGSVLTEADLDLAILQQLYIAQETAEEATKTIRTVADGSFDAQSRRVGPVATPTAPTDAATKSYVDAASGGAFAANAALSASAAGQSASDAADSAAAAAASAALAQQGAGVTDGDKGDITVSTTTNPADTWRIDGRTGSDPGVVTGTAGGELTAAMWNADGDLVQMTAAGGDAVPFSAPDGTGNLAATVNTLGDLASAVDVLSLSAAAPDVILQYTEVNGTSSGVTSSGWNTVPINTAVRNQDNLTTLSANTFSLPAGTYYIRWSQSFFASLGFQTRLYNVTDAVEAAAGLSGVLTNGGSGDSASSTGAAVVTIAAEKTFRLEAFLGAGRASLGIGYAASAGADSGEVYTLLEVWPVTSNSGGGGGAGGGGLSTTGVVNGGEFAQFVDADTFRALTAAETRTAISVDPAGTDNSTPVTVSGAYDYLTLNGQDLQLGQIDLGADVTGALPIANGGTGAATASAARAALGVDPAGTDNSTPVSVTGQTYASLSAQQITFAAIDLASHVTGVLPRDRGGLGADLGDPNADRLIFWDGSAGGYAYLSIGANLSISGTTLSASGSGGGTSVTLSGAYDYITLNGQDLELGQINLGTDVTGALPIANGGTGTTSAAGIRSAINVQNGATANSSDAALRDRSSHTGSQTMATISDAGALATADDVDRAILIEVVEAATDVATGDGAAYVTIPSFMAGMDLVAARADVVTAGTTGSTTIQVHNTRDSADMLSGLLTISSGATASSSVSINAANDDVASGDRLRIDVDSVSATAPQGLTLTLEFRQP